MKLHSTVIEKLLRIYSTYGGFREEHRLQAELEKLDLSEYNRQTGPKDKILVLTEDFVKHQK